MAALPHDALVVRGGMNRPETFAEGSDGKPDGVSVNSASGATVGELTAPNAATGYPGIPHNQIGVTSVGKVRSAGANVVASATKKNPHHAILRGVTPDQASELFRPTIENPSRIKK